MKRVTVGDVQHNFSKILRAVSLGEHVQVLRRKQVVARIVPDSDNAAAEYPDFVSRARKLFVDSSGSSPSQIIDEDREERL